MVRLAAAAALLLVTSAVSNAFVVSPPRQAVSFRAPSLVGTVRLNAAEQEPEAAAEQKTEETEVTGQEEESTEEKVSSDEQEEEPEDPQVTALKQEIADLESALKGKERDIQYQTEKVEELSKAGYARKVAEMETMRRARSMMNSSSREVAMSAVLQNFLPVLDDLISLETKYGQDDFGKSFNALGGAMRSAFKELGVTEYTVEPGTKLDKQRITVVEEKYSEEFEKDTVIEPIMMGMELQGNVVRMATCVVSLGSEQGEEEATEEEADEKEASQEEEEEKKEE